MLVDRVQPLVAAAKEIMCKLMCRFRCILRIALPITCLRVESSADVELILDAQNCNGDTPLHLAVLMALGSDIPTKRHEMDPEGRARLDKCLGHGSTRQVHGFTVRELACAQRLHNNRGLMPIHIAAAQGNAPVCELLLKAGAPVNARSLRREPLVHGHFCHPPRWGKRNEKGDLTEVAMADSTALHFTVGLLRDQRDLDKGWEECDLTLIRLLLRLGADVNAVNFCGQTPFHMAVIGRMHEVVALLAGAGADLTTGCKSFGRKNTALHLATLLRDVQMVKLLTELGASVDAIGQDGWTPLCLAARQGSPHVATALLAARANVFTPSQSGKTPLEIAIINSKYNKSPVLELLQHEVAVAVLGIACLRI